MWLAARDVDWLTRYVADVYSTGGVAIDDSAVADENHEGATKAMKQLAKTSKCTFCDKRVGKTQSFFYDGLDKGIICWNCLAGVN